MQVYLTLGSEKHLRAAQNAFGMLSKQSFANGGWGPDETLRAPDSPDVAASLTESHSFETPCGSYAHFNLTRYLLRVTGDSRYGDSMEHMMYNTVLRAKPLGADGRTFYCSDYNFKGRKVLGPSLGVLLRHAATGGSRLSHQHLLPRFARSMGELVHPIHSAMDTRWCPSGADAKEHIPVRRRGRVRCQDVASEGICVDCPDSTVGGGGLDFGKRPTRADTSNPWKLCGYSSPMEHGRPCRSRSFR